MTTVSLNTGTDLRSRLALWDRVRETLLARRDSRQFEKAISRSYGSEAGDLMALRRRY